MTKENIKLIKLLKANTDGVYRFKDLKNSYGLLILGRGENLFFQENDKALICELSATHSLLNPLTITKWDNGQEITVDEKNSLLEKISKYYLLSYSNNLNIFI